MRTNLDDETLKKISYVSISSYRIKTVQTLKDGKVKIPSNIAKDAGIRVNHISKVLSELRLKTLWNVLTKEHAREDSTGSLLMVRILQAT